MRTSFFSCFLFLLLQSTFGQTKFIDFSKIEFKGFRFWVKKQEVVTKLGKPILHYPKYECGYHADNWQDGGPYYQLKYTGFTYIGSDKERFVLEKVDFDRIGKIQLNYGQMTWSGQTTKEQIIWLFGDEIRDDFKKDERGDSVLIRNESTEDGAILTFKNGKLVRFEYWSPC